MFDIIYIIILKERYSLYASKCISNLVQFGYDISKVRFVNAVNGKNIEINFKYDVYKEWALENTNNVWWKKAVSYGEVGCALSHIKVWKEFLTTGYKNCLILEEDFYIHDNHNLYIDNMKRVDYEMFYLGKNNINPNIYIGDDYIECPDYSYNTHAYSINRTAAKKLINSNFQKNIIPVDEFLNLFFIEHERQDLKNLYVIEKLKTFCFKENIIGQSSNGNTEL